MNRDSVTFRENPCSNKTRQHVLIARIRRIGRKDVSDKFVHNYLQISNFFCIFAKNFIPIYATSKIAKQSQIEELSLPAKSVENLFKKISPIIEESRGYVATAVKLAEVYSKYQIGKYIVEEE